MSEKSAKPSYSMGWIMLLALFTSLGPLSIDMYLPALPQMANDLGVNTQQVTNTLPAYFLGLAVGQLIYGPISDRIGRKKPLYFGMSLFTLASLFCAIAPDHWSLIAARILQALGGCVGVVMARAAIRDRLDVQGSAQAFASMMIVMGVAPILAPTLGASILHFLNWRSIFIVLFVVGLICLLCVHFFFKETLSKDKQLHLSVKQVVTLYGAILTDKSFRFPMMAGCFSGAALFCYISSASMVFMEHFHLSQQQFAYAFGMNAFGIMLFSTLNKNLAKHWDVLKRLQIGGLIQLIGASIIVCVGLFQLDHLILLMSGLFLTISGIGFTGPNAMALAMSEQGHRAGTASAIMGSAQFACGLLGGVALNFLVWNSILNMGILMLAFIFIGAIAIFATTKRLSVKSTV